MPSSSEKKQYFLNKSRTKQTKNYQKTKQSDNIKQNSINGMNPRRTKRKANNMDHQVKQTIVD